MPALPASAPPWRDSKRWWWLLSPALPGLIWLNLLRFVETGQVFWLWLSPAVMYGLIPLLDALLGPDRSSPPESAVPGLERRLWYRAIVVAFVPLQYGMTIYGAWIATSQALTPLGWIGLILSVGGINGIAINTAHELGHKHPAWERWLARVALAPVAYGHFYIEHNRGHHRRVATPEDPASARLGESFWVFLPRTMAGSLRSAWALERARLAGRGLGVWHWRNECLQAWAMTVLLYGALAAWLGPGVLAFLAVQAFYGASLLEVVNYIEHYGLLRPPGPDGRPLRCRPEHSWNSSHRVSNLFLYQLQRHSDHHANPARRYQALRHVEQAPQLPSGYAAMLLLAYLPPLWFRVMDERVMRHYGGVLERANLQPGREAALRSRFPQPPLATLAKKS
ncbi:alkane 1-monooxygenase [Paucibacter sp. M5-1]|uniref:alkane 1-monooxygenase n=1 Tax=Paucibacter sp. M5-1 TaxID=3015998 RepID=UPI0022B8E94F|nr:alkane 1-monooxygenase [Paucibacter sp. M5-1]MCZ7880392.1 alkane 1-monooxygenase [Paucibacter sp. M5-1]